MINAILYFYGILVFFYSMTLIIIYVILIINSGKQQHRISQWNKDYIRQIIGSSPYIPGVSIVAGAYNEENTIIQNIESLLKQQYPLFEVIIVNDGSTDSTLQKMLDAFDLQEVAYDYVYKVYCKPFKKLYKSLKPEYDRLIVVDKVNGGTKADAINGGLNVAKYDYFINTDADCLLAKDAIFQCILPILTDRTIIAVSGTMSMSNGFRFDENGDIVEYKASNNIIPLFQDLEYKRSFLIGKMGWSNLNAMPNVSGGYGMFNTGLVLAAGGYSYDSFAEDMDMLWRMIAYCCEFRKPYRIVQINHTCCWTEGPANIKTLARQRVRWGRGLLQLVLNHWHMAFRRKYRRFGMITFPYEILFELLAPVIELVGVLVMIYLIIIGGVNWMTFWIMMAAIYVFSILLSGFIIIYDYLQGGSYNKERNYLKLLFAAITEPIIYHPAITLFSIKGYINHLLGRELKWGNMQHKGIKG